MDNDNDEFVREVELESCGVTLKFVQKNVGNVSCVIWDAAIVLAKYLDFTSKTNRWLQGKKVLELGAGLGCAGLTAACLGANVVLTDLKDTLPMLEKNVKVNKDSLAGLGGTAEAQVLDWGKEVKLNSKYDIILLTDCVYYEKSVQPLLCTLEIFCDADCGTYTILSQEERDTPKQVVVWKQFLTELKKRFEIEYIPVSQQHPTYSSADIHLIKIHKIKQSNLCK
ncbi:protein-lysine methyltransferase METTL21D-like [Copidosoma floridanum]|uniref:protein-lysine methyltransferase METTL21D-like n=1 Tax=Copidosoma floridanum TaxID=29053 RepID=UPI0006C961A8|nr:protein-lysine methyltransferase METTL21D-like [Copidosoma floridanum]